MMFLSDLNFANRGAMESRWMVWPKSCVSVDLLAPRHAPNPFRINTYKRVWKQRALTTFRINTYEKKGGRGIDSSSKQRTTGRGPSPSRAKGANARGVKSWDWPRSKSGIALCLRFAKKLLTAGLS